MQKCDAGFINHSVMKLTITYAKFLTHAEIKYKEF